MSTHAYSHLTKEEANNFDEPVTLKILHVLFAISVIFQKCKTNTIKHGTHKEGMSRKSKCE